MIRMKIYGALVNRHPGISYRYHKVHDNSRGMGKVFSWVYLLWLNFAYYVLFCRSLGSRPEIRDDMKKTAPDIMHSESELALTQLMISVPSVSEAATDMESKGPGVSPAVMSYVSKLEDYDLISFDVFDTLIFRPFGHPTELFYLVGERLGILNFRELRINAEKTVRERSVLEKGHSEVTLTQIWEELESQLGINAKEGMVTEIETEMNLCYANPFMLEVWHELIRRKKKLIVTSDMYLPEEVIAKILEKNGFTGAERLYVSCEYGKNKAGGGLYDLILSGLRDLSETSGGKGGSEGKKMCVHVGDDRHSDGDMAKKAGFEVVLYPKTDRKMFDLRPYDMSSVAGGAYRGIVSNRLYSGQDVCSMEYEYGYVYGGLFVLGYCNFIHEYCKKEGVDKILFLSRDGDILRKVYAQLYPEEKTEYVYWSRKAALKLMAGHNKYDYFRRFIDHKSGQGYSVESILLSMELEFLAECLKAHPEAAGLDPDDELTQKNAGQLKRYIESEWLHVLEIYSEQGKVAEKYYRERLKDTKHAAVVDIGWAGSGALNLSYLAEKVWGLPCTFTGIIAGTNTPYNDEPDASEAFLQSGKLVAYMFSQSHNRDLLRKHDPGRGYNIFWELLLSSPTEPFEGFYPAVHGGEEPDDKYCINQKGSFLCDEVTGVMLKFGEPDVTPETALEIQHGITDFVKEYSLRFKEYPYMFKISGRDAYAPVIAASRQNERYLKEISRRAGLRINVE